MIRSELISCCAFATFMVAVSSANAAFERIGPNYKVNSAAYSPLDGKYYVISRDRNYSTSGDYYVRGINPATGAVTDEGNANWGTSITIAPNGDWFLINSNREIWKHLRSENRSVQMPTNLCDGGTFVPTMSLARNALAYGQSWPLGGLLWAIGSDGQLYRLGFSYVYPPGENRPGCWSRAPSLGGTVTSVAINYDIPRSVGGPTIYNNPVVSLSNNNMYNMTGGAWEPFHGGGGLAYGVAQWLGHVKVIGLDWYFWHWSSLSSGWARDTSYDGSSGANVQLVNVPPNGTTVFGIAGAYVDQNGQLWQKISSTIN